MKIAVCMSGHMRTYEKSLPYIKEQLLNYHNCDIFIHTWEDKKTNWNHVIKEYKPKSICIEEQKQFLDNYPNKHLTSQHIRSNLGVIGMYYKIYKCNELKIEHEKIYNKYDIVIRIRPDGILNKKIEFEIEFESEFLNNIYVTVGNNNTWISDTFAYSSSENMNLYSNTYNHLNEFYDKENSLHPETMLRHCFNKYNLNPKINNMKFSVLRESNILESHIFTGEIEDFLKL